MKGGSVGAQRTTGQTNNRNDSKTPSQMVDPLQCIMSGSEHFAKQLYDAGKLREEYTMRCDSIRKDVSRPVQDNMRDRIKLDTRARQNAVGKVVVGQVLEYRKKKDARDIQQGKTPTNRRNNPQKTNDLVNKAGKISKVAGKALGAAAVGCEVYNVYNAPEGERFKELTRAGGRLGGGFAAGAATGAALGALGCNPVTVVAGSLIGGIAGSTGAEVGVNALWDHIDKK